MYGNLFADLLKRCQVQDGHARRVTLIGSDTCWKVRALMRWVFLRSYDRLTQPQRRPTRTTQTIRRDGPRRPAQKRCYLSETASFDPSDRSSTTHLLRLLLIERRALPSCIICNQFHPPPCGSTRLKTWGRCSIPSSSERCACSCRTGERPSGLFPRTRWSRR